ncbi:hypothetical protein KDE13_07470 [Campylobacter sp. faydin G-140]|uniref:hypothetical protein n=1 Tax=Campylobacter anatolicus TaxID=2829105 RepID=UPI001B99E775|nr:hypothetical protein [Campylobacter anatolicus]MBR8466176.1 hypothetical protein [Campylobacter anatolicus]
MLSKRAKEILLFKGKSGIKIPDDEILSELFLEAMLYVATKCTPSELMERYVSPKMQVFRNLANETFIRIPKKPDFKSDTEHLQIDEELSYAVIYEVLYLLNKEPFNRQQSLEIIAQYNANEGLSIDDVR